MTRIYAPKKPCPRDLGYWFCDECRAKHLEEQSWLDFPIPVTGCGVESLEGPTCGATHLGYEWCDECKASNRVALHPHCGEFEVVMILREKYTLGGM